METAARRVIELAISQLGVKEEPFNSSNVVYNRDYYGGKVNSPNLHWCLVFIWWLFKECGLDIYGPKTASCTTFVNTHKAWIVDSKDAQPGDLIFFNFSGSKKNYEHVGILEKKEGDWFHTIDGNTGSTSEANGGMVMRRKRHSMYVISVLHPPYPVENVDNQIHFVDEIPEGYGNEGKLAVTAAINCGAIKMDATGAINLYESSIQPIVIMYRRGLFGKFTPNG